MEKTLYTIIIYSENFTGLLSQVAAVFTRRQINIESLCASASAIENIHKYIITTQSDRESIEKVVRQIEKKIDVIQALFFTDDEIYFHETALYKLATPEFENNPEASKLIRRYNARIVEVNPTFLIVEKSGMTEEISQLYEQLQAACNVMQFVRSGRVAITKNYREVVSEYLASRQKKSEITE